MNKSTVVSVLSIGIAIGACAREIVREAAPAAAHAAPSGRYHVIMVYPSDWEAAERELNDQAKAGWRYAGSFGPGIAVLEHD